MKIESSTASVDEVYHFVRALNLVHRARCPQSPPLKIDLSGRNVVVKCGEEAFNIAAEIDAIQEIERHFRIAGNTWLQKCTTILITFHRSPTNLCTKVNQARYDAM